MESPEEVMAYFATNPNGYLKSSIRTSKFDEAIHRSDPIENTFTVYLFRQDIRGLNSEYISLATHMVQDEESCRIVNPTIARAEVINLGIQTHNNQINGLFKLARIPFNKFEAIDSIPVEHERVILQYHEDALARVVSGGKASKIRSTLQDEVIATNRKFFSEVFDGSSVPTLETMKIGRDLISTYEHMFLSGEYKLRPTVGLQARTAGDDTRYGVIVQVFPNLQKMILEFPDASHEVFADHQIELLAG